MAPTPIALTIAGSDSSGGAGIQADLKTFTAHAVYGASVITALTAQNTLGVQAVEVPTVQFIVRQIDSVLDDLRVDAAKTGMLATAEIVDAVAARLQQAPDLPVVVDPVMVATSGDALLAPDAVAAVRGRLMPRARLLTPNLHEAARLLDRPLATTPTEAADQAKALRALGARAVLVKGGHGTSDESIDMLCDERGTRSFTRPRVVTRHSHGTGCTLSAAIAAHLAAGADLDTAIDRAKDYVWQGLVFGRDIQIGRGSGPVDHLHLLRGGRPAAT